MRRAKKWGDGGYGPQIFTAMGSKPVRCGTSAAIGSKVIRNSPPVRKPRFNDARASRTTDPQIVDSFNVDSRPDFRDRTARLTGWVPIGVMGWYRFSDPLVGQLKGSVRLLQPPSPTWALSESDGSERCAQDLLIAGGRMIAAPFRKTRPHGLFQLSAASERREKGQAHLRAPRP